MAAPASAAPAAPADIVFSRAGDLHVRALDGAERALTRGAPYDEFPAWSPDRSRIAFVRDGDLYVARADGSAPRRIVRRPGFERYPAWSPDGRRIAFAANHDRGEYDIHVVRRDGRGLRRLTRTARHVEDTQPAFTPDGRHIVFASNRLSFFNFEIYRMRASDGGGLKRLTHHGTGADGAPGDDIHPDVSPDGKRIAFVSDRGGGYAVWTMATDGADLRRVVRHRRLGHAFPRFSPDGSRLVYMTLPLDEREDPRLWTVPALGGGPVALGGGRTPDW
jgi:TolB protein